MSAAPTTAGAMKAVLTDERFSRPGLDLRAQAGRHPLHRHPRRVVAADALAQRPVAQRALPGRGRRRLSGQSRERFVVDGEVVSVSGRFQDDGPRLYHVFDVLWLDGEDVRALPLRERKALLRDALTWEDPLRLVPYRNEEGEAMFAEACANGWEGVIAKRADSVYTAKRSKDWLKFKCEAGPGAGDRRVHAAEGHAHRARRAARRRLRRRRPALRRQGRHGLQPRDAARPRRGAAPAGARRDARSTTPRASATSPGSSPSSSPRSASPNGPATAACATRATSACATTRTRARSSARAR